MAVDTQALLEVAVGTVWFLAVIAGLFVPLQSWWSRRRCGLSLGAFVAIGALLVVNTVSLELVAQILLDPLAATLEPEPSLAGGVAVFLLAELGAYFLHRAMHDVPWLWRFHRLHHRATEPVFIDAWLQHPVDFVLHGLVVALPGVLLGVSLSELVTVVLLRKVYTTWLHADVGRELRGLEQFLATPAFHRGHHEADARGCGRNFAGTLPVLDRVFGTLVGPQRQVQTDSPAGMQPIAAVEPGRTALRKIEGHAQHLLVQANVLFVLARALWETPETRNEALERGCTGRSIRSVDSPGRCRYRAPQAPPVKPGDRPRRSRNRA